MQINDGTEEVDAIRGEEKPQRLDETLKKIFVRWIIVADMRHITHQRHKLTYAVSQTQNQVRGNRHSR